MIFFQEHISEFYKSKGRKNLPWRKKNITAYEVWVSEIMLQQTQVSRVIDYFNNCITRFPTVFELANATWEEFLPYYAGLGYYRRGQNMLKTAKMVVEDYGGEFPRTKQELCSLPGIGDYTASAILSFAYNDNHLAFDTNLQRVFGRYLYGDKKAALDTEKINTSFQRDTQKFNGAIMDFANLICTSKPKCLECPLTEKCRYYLEDGKNEVKNVKQKENFPTREAQVFLWLHKEHQEYYSPNPDEFEVFVLPPSVNNREKIKNYFRLHYGLELAVRPPHKKTFVDNKPTLFINAQILLGDHEFGVFGKEEIGLAN